MTTWKLKGAGLVLFCAMDVHAASQYTLKYDFNSSFAPGIITATFNGVAQGNRITNLSNISVWFNGQPFNGNGSLSNFAVEYAYSYDPFSGFYLTPNYLAN